MTTHDLTDITIIGGGPTGLFAQFYAGMRKATSRIIDALPDLGGQLTALYPEKLIFDVGGFPKVLAKDLVNQLAAQAGQFGAKSYLGERVIGLTEENGHFVVVTEQQRFPTRAIVIAGGIGAFSPRRLPQPCAEPWYGRGVHEIVTDPEEFRGRRIMIIGGGDSAFDWAHQLLDRAASVTLVHRSDRFRAHAATVSEVESAAAQGRAQLLTFHELADITSANVGGHHVRRRPVERRGAQGHQGEDDAGDGSRRDPANARVRERPRRDDGVGPEHRQRRDHGDEHHGDGASRHLRRGRHHDVPGKAQAHRDGIR
jgi:ferredoxin/flavodoxin---NADP+ reductase